MKTRNERFTPTTRPHPTDELSTTPDAQKVRSVDHITTTFCEFHEYCGQLWSHCPLPQQEKPQCRSVCRYCARAGEQCVLTDPSRVSERHRQCHTAEVTSELVRPWPLGTTFTGPPLPPQIRGSSYTDTISALNTHVWSKQTTTTFRTTLTSSFMQRVLDCCEH